MTEIMETEPVKPAQTPAPATEPTGWMSPDGEIREGAPENIKALLDAKKWTNVEQIVDGYNELGAFKGIAEIMQNVPETADGYEYAYSGEGESPINDELLNGFFQLAHTKKWPKQFVQEVIDFQLDAVTEQDKVFKTQLADREEKNIQAMKQKWGEANYDATFKGIEATAEKLGVLEFFRNNGIDKEPEIVNMLITIANSDKEDTITQQPPVPAKKTPQERLAEIKKSEAFTQRFHPDHKKIMEEFVQINQQIADSGQATQPRI